MPANPAASVRGPTHVVRTGKTPVQQPTEARLLLDTIDTSTVRWLRDRALLAVMVYSFPATARPRPPVQVAHPVWCEKAAEARSVLVESPK